MQSLAYASGFHAAAAYFVRAALRLGGFAFQEFQEFGFERGLFAGGGLAFPDDEGLPALLLEGAAVAAVAVGVAVDFGEPVIAAGGGDAAGSAGVSVPEAAVDEDDFFEAGEDEVGGGGEGGDVEAGAVAEGVDEAADLPTHNIQWA
jgi:hypothetical protein